MPSFFMVMAAIGLAIAVACLRLAVLLAVTSTTQRRSFWVWLVFGGALGLIGVVALFWGFAADMNTTWGVSALACAGDFVCTLVAQPELATSAEDAA
ncbi:MAG: hypothetical protein LKJ69_04975 [Lactobacillus sp.]|jgi:hypothetical protein|nr:hypothetical protein [Lactobacillus sp.]MCI2032737.1 hypothetical protein [Lactobacillus sp.]